MGPVEVSVHYAGQPFVFRHADGNDHIFQILKNTGEFYEQEFLSAVRKFLREGDNVVDVGANIGTHTVFFAGVCKCNVFSFEPNPVAAHLLEQNIKANHLTRRVRIRRVAVGAANGYGKLAANADHNLGATKIVKDIEGNEKSLRIAKLSDLISDAKIRLIKIDVEGMDLDVLLGAENLIARDKPIITTEAATRSDFSRIFEVLERHGYLPFGSLNYTPTHIFIHADELASFQMWSVIQKQMALDYIDRAILRDQISDLRRKLSILPNEFSSGFAKFAHELKEVGSGTNQKWLVDLAEAISPVHVELKHAAKLLSEVEEKLGDENLKRVFESGQSQVGKQLAFLQSQYQQLETKVANLDRQIASSINDLSHTLQSGVGEQLKNIDERIRDAARVMPDQLQARILEFDRKVDTIAEAVVDLKVELSANYASVSEVSKSIRENQSQIEGIPALVAGALAGGMELLTATSRNFAILAKRMDEQAQKETERGENFQNQFSIFESRLASMTAELSSVVYTLNQAGGTLSELSAENRNLSKMVSNAVSDWQVNFNRLLELAADWVAASDLAQAAADQDAALLQIQWHSLYEGKNKSPVDADMQSSIIALREKVASEHLEKNASRNTKNTETSPAKVALVGGPRDVWRVVRPNENKKEIYISPRDSNFAKPQPAAQSGDVSTIVTAPGDQIIAIEEFVSGWQGKGWAQGKAALEQGGVVRATIPGDAGMVSRQIDLPGGGLVEIEVVIKAVNENNIHPFLRIIADDNDGVGYDMPLSIGVKKVKAFASNRTRRIKFYILAHNCKSGDSFAIQRLVVKRVDADAHQRMIRRHLGEPVLASMASIPSRREMLADCVHSLLVQCDQVRVFLNNYPDVPEFLMHPRVEVRRSQDWDDRGDAGKVFWLEQDKTPGFRLIVDDDLIFPPDFAEVMCAKVAAKGKKAIYATHGVLIRQPITNYYDRRSRAATFHFGHGLDSDRSVHIGATNALCLHSEAISMRWADFKYCNSADIWLALHAQENGLEVLTPARPRNWVRENHHTVPDETIYKHSVNRTRTRFDSSLVQDAALKHNWPLTVHVGKKSKYGLLVNVGSTDNLTSSIESAVEHAGNEAEWVIMLAYDRGQPLQENAVSEVTIQRETHLLDTGSDPGGLKQAADLIVRLNLGAVLGLDGSALVSDSRRSVASCVPETRGEVTLTKLKTDQGHIVGVVVAPGDGIPDGMLRFVEKLSLGEPSSSDFDYMLNKHCAFKINKTALSTAKSSEVTINKIFKQVKVLNLDRRPDRWERVTKSLTMADIEAQRFSAVDGSEEKVATEYQRYLEQPRTKISANVPEIRYQRDLYMNYASQAARVSYLERQGKKAIASRGAWGYLKSYEAVLEEALAANTESLLVLDDDVLLHREIKTLFAQAMKELPDDWLILQLGTLQYNWSPPWADWHSPMLYRTNGSAVGSHAVGMRFDIIPYLLDHVRRFDMPYDIGALSAATRAFPDRCFVIYPNLAIQSMVDSDIGTSDFQKAKKREDIMATYRWKLDDYQ
ncbi:FkbM family methyltransferase [Methylocella sp. CPCC 101449]|uniref:FkbM family methyltransferase n=1 Tax=Methylocella sp. CPCC 101449 TaxID=2987531 RepID=UPI00289266F7|nr:FkbM family methyltransferase [Methylocella sp. CPCC 101449]MDT2019456.1 FkbM family methyltransferase [Methylocella sp. CPCC 101449]